MILTLRTRCTKARNAKAPIRPALKRGAHNSGSRRLNRNVTSSLGTSWSASFIIGSHPRPKSAAVGWLACGVQTSTQPRLTAGFFLGSCQRRALSFFHRGGLLNTGTGTRGTVARCIIGEAGIER